MTRPAHVGWAAFGLAAALAFGCDRSTAKPAPSAASDAAVSATAAGDAGAAKRAAAVESWRGSYRSSPAPLYIPPGWKGVHFVEADAATGVGEGTIDFHVDGTTGRLSGEVDGPLGPATVDGVARDGRLAATLRRRNPSDRGFTGTLVGTFADGKGQGTISASPGEASAVRTADFTVSAQPEAH